MASIAELVRVVASAEGFEENFVSVYARSAREAGFISHHGRGRNAARMTPIDAAHLLIAVNASPLAKEVPETITNFRCLRLPHDLKTKLQYTHHIEHLAKEGIYFVDALAFLLDRDPECALNIETITHLDFFGSIPAPPPHPDFNPHPGKPHVFRHRGQVVVEFLGTQPGAKITITNFEADDKGSPAPVEFLSCRFYDVDQKLEYMGSDRTISISITSETLRMVSELLHT